MNTPANAGHHDADDADRRLARGAWALIVLIAAFVVLAAVLLFARSLWWEEDGATVPRGTSLRPPSHLAVELAATNRPAGRTSLRT